MSKQDEQRLLVKIATLYYVDGMKQSEIAGLLQLSQSFVSRAITRCQKEGVVKISVIQPPNIFLSLEHALEQKYGIRQAIVVDVDEPASAMQIKHAIGSAAAHYVETRLRPGDLVGISSWSSTIRAMVDELHPQSIKASARLVASDDVAEVVGKFSEVDVAILGIGDLEPSQLLKNSGNYYGETMLQTLAARGAVGDICLHYYNADGEPVLSKEEDPVIGMELNQVRQCPHVVALAGGTEKVNAIRGALKGKYIDVLITDYPTARELA